MKKILFKSGSTMLGGLEKVQVEYINFLIKYGYNIEVVIENDNGVENKLENQLLKKVVYLKSYDYIKKMKKLRMKKDEGLLSKIVYNINLQKEKKYSDKKFLEIYNKFSPDIVIDFDSSLTKIVKKLNTSKNIVWIHSSVEHWKKKKSRIKKYIKRVSYYDKVICICKEMEEELKGLDLKLESKLDYIYNPIDKEKIIKLSEKKFEEQEKKYLDERFLLMVSRLDTIPKDFETLIKGYELSKEKGYEGKLYILGDGPNYNEVNEMVMNSKCSKDIELLGSKLNPYNWMKQADKIILSSKYEGFGIVLLEGMLLGKTCISSNCKTGPKELLSEGRGFLFNVGDAKGLSKLIIEDNYIREMNLTKFDQENIFKKLIEVLEE